MTTIAIYNEILFAMALFIFIVNQANVLFDRFHIAWITRQTRKRLYNRMLNPGNEDEVKVKEEWHAPHISWGKIGVFCGIAFFLLIVAFTVFLPHFGQR